MYSMDLTSASERPAWAADRDRVGLEEIEAVYRRSHSALLRVCAAILGDGHEAMDAVQEGFATAIRRQASYQGTGSVDAWVWKIVVNSARMRRRQATGRPTPRPLTDVSQAHVDPLSDQEYVRALVRTLPERQRLVLFLRYFSGLDYREIAEVADIAVGTVSATINAAHTGLRRAIEEAGHDA